MSSWLSMAKAAVIELNEEERQRLDTLAHARSGKRHETLRAQVILLGRPGRAQPPNRPPGEPALQRRGQDPRPLRPRAARRLAGSAPQRPQTHRPLPRPAP